MKRIKGINSVYNTKKWEDDYKTSLYYKGNNCEYPPIDFTKPSYVPSYKKFESDKDKKKIIRIFSSNKKTNLYNIEYSKTKTNFKRNYSEFFDKNKKGAKKNKKKNKSKTAFDSGNTSLDMDEQEKDEHKKGNINSKTSKTTVDRNKSDYSLGSNESENDQGTKHKGNDYK